VRLALLVVLLLAAGCATADVAADTIAAAPIEATPTPEPTATPAPPPPEPTVVPPPAVTVGAEVLADNSFAALDGRRVGLIANQTSLVRGEHLIDVLHNAPNVELTAVFAPEHGVRGNIEAGLLDDTVDFSTGVTIFSLYNETRQPTPEMLEDVDVLVFDLQDVGTRFYTFISTMGLSMQSAATAGIPFVVLDRPNPIGDAGAAGFTLEPDQLSFIGQYPIPSSYGLTSGELALAIKGERWLPGLDDLEIQVVELAGWSRSMLWPATEREWVPPSPGLPTFESALAYPGAVLFEATSISYGGGTLEPFSIFGAAWADGDALAAELSSRNLPGVTFEAVTFTPMPIEGITEDPRLNGETMFGVRYIITDAAAFDPVESGLHVLDAFNRQAAQLGITDFVDRPQMLDLLAGTSRLRELVVAGVSADDIIAAWEPDAAAFDDTKRQYLLYD